MTIGEQLTEPSRRHLTERQAELAQRLVSAAEHEAETQDYNRISVRSIAKRAGVAPATAYTYFSSKDHLLAEVLWRRIHELPEPVVDCQLPAAERVAEMIRFMGIGIVESPAIVAATTRALLAAGPDVQAARERIGGEILRRLASALGPDANPEVLGVLNITYSGAMLAAGLGHFTFAELPDLLARAARLLLKEAS
jgi:AcrR family transcriptional regulator